MTLKSLLDTFWLLLVLTTAALFFGLSVHLTIDGLARTTNNITPANTPIGADFLGLWSGGHLAAMGKAELAYQPAELFAVQKETIPNADYRGLWHYPPTYSLAMAPFGALPYLTALPLFLGLTLALMLIALWRLWPSWWAVGLTLAYPGLWYNLHAGQNGFLITALFAFFLALLQERPKSAGVALGLLAIKPQLALLTPFALLAGRHLASFKIATITVLVFIALSIAVLGPAAWQGFFAHLPLSQQVINSAYINMDRMTAVFTATRSWNLPVLTAYVTQIIAMALSAIIVIALWRQQNAPAALKGVVLIAGCLLSTPFLFTYDMMLLLPALLLYTRYGLENGWHKGERPLLYCLWLGPFIFTTISEQFKLQLFPLAVLALMLMALARSQRLEGVKQL